jgi:hypothetical protein
MHIRKTGLMIAAILVACGGDRYQSPTAPITPPPPTQEAPAADVSGTWEGTYTAEPLECESSSGPAKATFEQVGASVSGVLTGASKYCGFQSKHFEGVLEGVTLSGALTDWFPDAHASGAVVGETLELHVLNVYNYTNGVLRLERKQN